MVMALSGNEMRLSKLFSANHTKVNIKETSSNINYKNTSGTSIIVAL